jgi:hypothetical protein
MAITHGQPQRGEATTGVVRNAVEITRAAARGGWFATAFSAVAVGLSCVSVYVSTLQAPSLEVHVPPTIHYGRDSGGDVEVFAIPVTVANSGARTATVVSMELEVENLATKATKRFFSVFLGEHPRDAASLNRQFAPQSIPGRAIFTETVRFYPAGDALPRLVADKGEYAFRLKLNVAAPARPSFLDWLQGRIQPAPIAFQMTLPWYSDQTVGMRRGVIIMHAKDWLPTTASADR